LEQRGLSFGRIADRGPSSLLEEIREIGVVHNEDLLAGDADSQSDKKNATDWLIEPVACTVSVDERAVWPTFSNEC
jgi:hypothetical protein